MSYPKSNFPIGAKWEYKDGTIKHFIEFSRMNGAMEIWTYGRVYSDGSGCKSDWTFSYRSAKKHCYTSGRFKRVK